MKVWRSRKRKLENLEPCSCLYHQAAENEDDSCGCVYHTEPDSDCECEIHLQAAIESETGSDCECDVHMQAAEVSDHSVSIFYSELLTHQLWHLCMHSLSHHKLVLTLNI